MSNVINDYNELMALVEERRKEVLVLEIDLGGAYSTEHEEAKRELNQAKAINALTGDQSFLSDNIKELEEKVEATKPESKSIFVKFKKLPITEWAALMKQVTLNPIDQYEKVLPKTFIGIYGSDEEGAEPLSTDHRLLSTKGDLGILPGGSINNVISTFIAWQNNGSDVVIHPTR